MKKRLLKKRKKRGMAMRIVTTWEDYRWRCSLGSFANKIFGIKEEKENSPFVPMSAKQFRREVSKEIKKIRFKNKWTP